MQRTPERAAARACSEGLQVLGGPSPSRSIRPRPPWVSSPASLSCAQGCKTRRFRWNNLLPPGPETTTCPETAAWRTFSLGLPHGQVGPPPRRRGSAGAGTAPTPLYWEQPLSSFSSTLLTPRHHAASTLYPVLVPFSSEEFPGLQSYRKTPPLYPNICLRQASWAQHGENPRFT